MANSSDSEEYANKITLGFENTIPHIELIFQRAKTLLADSKLLVNFLYLSRLNAWTLARRLRKPIISFVYI